MRTYASVGVAARPATSERPALATLLATSPRSIGGLPRASAGAGRASQRVGERDHRLDDLAEIEGQPDAVDTERVPVRAAGPRTQLGEVVDNG